MKRLAWSLGACALGAVGACVLAWGAAPARADVVLSPPTPPPPTAKPSPAPSAPASAAPPLPSAASGPGADAALPGFEAETFGDEASKAPTAEEWRAAKELAPTRRGARAYGCHVWKVREWVRVSCPDLVTASVAMLGGTPTGMSFWIDPPKEGSGGKLPAGGEVMFPVRRGDRRVVQFLSFGPGYEGPFTQLPALIVQELWLESAPAPALLLY